MIQTCSINRSIHEERSPWLGQSPYHSIGSGPWGPLHPRLGTRPIPLLF